MKYTVFCEGTEIGVLEINDDGQHRYTPNSKGVEAVKDKVALIHEMQVKTEWGNPIPFFKNRLENAARFNREEEVYSHTDLFRMIKEE